MTKTVSVVIPTYRRPTSATWVVNYYLTISLVDEILVLHDGPCPQDLRSAYASLACKKRVNFKELEARVGPAGVRNAGVEAVENEWILFCDDDNILWPPKSVGKMLSIASIKKADIVGTVTLGAWKDRGLNLEYSGTGDDSWEDAYYRFILEKRSQDELEVRLTGRPFFSPFVLGIMLVRREVANEVAYSRDFGLSSYRDETDFQLRALSEGYACVCVPEIAVLESQYERDLGGTGALNDLQYALEAVSNNWKMLKRNRSLIRSIHGDVSIVLIQVLFTLYMFTYRLPLRVGSKLRRLLFAAVS